MKVKTAAIITFSILSALIVSYLIVLYLIREIQKWPDREKEENTNIVKNTNIIDTVQWQQTATVEKEDAILDSIVNTTAVQADYLIPEAFAFVVDGKEIVFDYKCDEAFFEKTFGKPVSVSEEDEIEKETWHVTRRILTYDGFEIQFKGPRDGSKVFWPDKLVISGPQLIMKNGIKAGDEFEKVKEIYLAFVKKTEKLGKYRGKSFGEMYEGTGSFNYYIHDKNENHYSIEFDVYHGIIWGIKPTLPHYD